MMRLTLILLALIAFTNTTFAKSKSPKNAKVYIISPKNGETVGKTFRVVFGLQGMGIAPAGVEKENTGHHHLLISRKITDEDLDNPLPADDNLKHFGGGQTETDLSLKPGTYTLQLLLGDHNHVPHDKPVKSEIITITVK